MMVGFRLSGGEWEKKIAERVDEEARRWRPKSWRVDER